MVDEFFADFSLQGSALLMVLVITLQVHSKEQRTLRWSESWPQSMKMKSMHRKVSLFHKTRKNAAYKILVEVKKLS